MRRRRPFGKAYWTGTSCRRERLRPVIRYFALAFIFFQVATTAALATELVLFAETGPNALPPSSNPAQLVVKPAGTRDNIDRYPKVTTLCVEVPATSAPSP